MHVEWVSFALVLRSRIHSSLWPVLKSAILAVANQQYYNVRTNMQESGCRTAKPEVPNA